jgi:hypothetical protein
MGTSMWDFFTSKMGVFDRKFGFFDVKMGGFDMKFRFFDMKKLVFFDMKMEVLHTSQKKFLKKLTIVLNSLNTHPHPLIRNSLL